MSVWPYPREAVKAFEAIEFDALIATAIADECEGSAKALKYLPEASKRRIAQLERRAKALRQLIQLAGFMSGRVDRLDILETPVRR